MSWATPWSGLPGAGEWSLWLPPVALALDLVLADPRRLPHPVQAVGWLLDRMEAAVRARVHPPTRLAGVFCLCLMLIAVAVCVQGILGLPVAGVLAACYLAWAGLAAGSLLSECGRALEAVAHEDIAVGRHAVSMLVSRDVSQAGRDDLHRALAETLAENFNDGVIAPFFWLVLGGPLWLWLYKAVSTMDSMWGYRTEEWRALGWAGARLDDCLAFVPARLAALFLLLAAPLAGVRATDAGGRAGGSPGVGGCSGLLSRLKGVCGLIGLIAADARTMESPNAGWPMAAAAWLHGRRMGGPTTYFGQTKDKPVLGPRGECGDEARPTAQPEAQAPGWDAVSVRALLRHVRAAALLGCAVMWGAVALLF